MDDSRKKPGWAFWMVVGLSLPVLYALSFGPACWWLSAAETPQFRTDLPVNLSDGYDLGMTFLLPFLAVAFAAFCVWLTVRIVNRPERWAKWMLVAVVGVPALYVLSLGPACWIASHAGSGAEFVSMIYGSIIFDSPAFVADDLRQYSHLGAAQGWHWRQVSGGWTNLPAPGMP